MVTVHGEDETTIEDNEETLDIGLGTIVFSPVDFTGVDFSSTNNDGIIEEGKDVGVGVGV